MSRLVVVNIVQTPVKTVAKGHVETPAKILAEILELEIVVVQIVPEAVRQTALEIAQHLAILVVQQHVRRVVAIIAAGLVKLVVQAHAKQVVFKVAKEGVMIGVHRTVGLVVTVHVVAVVENPAHQGGKRHDDVNAVYYYVCKY